MERILVSSCLLGAPVRYDGRAKTSGSAILARWRREGRVLSFCPELAGGLAVPRPAAERRGLQVITIDGQDVTPAFRLGASLALAAAQKEEIRFAVLKENSPSCGSNTIADGTFTGTKIPDVGVTTELLRSHGIRVFNENQLETVDAMLTE
ncbi:DUF523 domain-containing protein [Actinocorallia longicatena]|uniref:DUF523 domain-containing protein n=1 Tax=Actinocorallia longicatena TaxID=111803 RepID=A0ABP6QHM0_9ACTN